MLALSVSPTAALAQDTGARPALTADQRQAMRQTFEQFAQQEKQLHEQMRSQILSSLSPVHLRAVAATIGDLAIEQNPDPQAAAKRLDQILSPGERQRIITAHSSFAQQSRQLHDQMRTQLQSEMPAGHANWMGHGPRRQDAPAPAVRRRNGAADGALAASDAGDDGVGHGHGMMQMEGAPPQ